MKAHIGVDSDSALTHKLLTTAAHVCEIAEAHASLHGDGSAAFGGAGYQKVLKNTRGSDPLGEVARCFAPL
jgi:IS5 family transposase